MKQITWVFLLFTFFSGFSQKPTMLRGNIHMDTLEIGAINIINLTREIGTINDTKGYFEIRANQGDVIVFSSVQIQTKKVYSY